MNAFMRYGTAMIAAQFLAAGCAVAQSNQVVQEGATTEKLSTIDCRQFGKLNLVVITVEVTEDPEKPQDRIKVYGCQDAVDPDLGADGSFAPRFPNSNVAKTISLDSIGVSTFRRREGNSHICVDINRGGGWVQRICPRH